MTGAVRVRLYASAREAVGAPTIRRPTGPEGVLVDVVLRELAEAHPSLSPILRHSRFARNGTYLRGSRARLRAGDELAIHPPYSGG
jgi:molybdopterin converting factor small subunit